MFLIMSGSILGGITLFLICLLIYRAIRQRLNARALAIRTPNGIAEGLFVRVGGIDQWIQIRGEDRANPVVLVLHGGPGLSYVPFTPAFRSWEHEFTVVQWDQRGAGRTLSRNGKMGDDAMTIDRMAHDGIEVAEFLCKHLNASKLILVAHSWGTILGVSMIVRRPDLFSAYVGTGQVVTMANGEAISYELALERARALDNAKAIRALETIGRPPYKDIKTWMVKQRRIMSITPHPPDTADLNMFSAALFTPGYSLKDAATFFSGFMSSPAKLYHQIMAYDLRQLATTFAVPIFFFQGDADIQTPTEPVKDYFAEIQAPHKELLLIPGEGHVAVLTVPKVFLQELVARVRPLVLATATSASLKQEYTTTATAADAPLHNA